MEERSLAATGTAQSHSSLSCLWPIISKITPNIYPGTISPFLKAQGQENTQNPSDI